MLQNKRLLGGIAAFVLLVLVGGYFLFANKSTEPTNEEGMVGEELQSLTPDEIGLEIVASFNNRQVKFIINKPQGFESVEFELAYEADDPQSPGNRVTRGVAGEEEIDPNEDVFESEFFDLGSCSSGTCRYDTGVEQVDLLLKLTKTDGTMYQVEDSLEL